jgi:hypothetical protein
MFVVIGDLLRWEDFNITDDTGSRLSLSDIVKVVLILFVVVFR